MGGKVFLGRYETIRLLGEGGMGRVYLAWQNDLSRHVVVKVMHDHIAADARFRERFMREMLLMARFHHPYVVALHDASLNDPNGPCIVMEYVKGVTLDHLLRKNHRINAGRADRILGQLCEALYAAHKEGIIHRDLKPANLMVVDADTPYEKIKVMDFGLAKLASGKNSFNNNRLQEKPTQEEFAVGTPGYISPEQIRGEDVDHRCDLYSVGVILYELLVGKLPFTRADTMDVLLAHVNDEPLTFDRVGAAGVVPAAVENVVLRCLEKDPKDRPASARDLASEFHAAVVDYHRNDDAPAPVESPPQISEGGETEVTKEQTRLHSPVYDPNVLSYRLEAWMPDAIATFKLRGFVNDNNAEVLKSIPGSILVRLGGKKAAKGLNWLGLGRSHPLIDVELKMERSNPSQPNLLSIQIAMTSPEGKSQNKNWRERCAETFCELRSYLAGASVS